MTMITKEEIINSLKPINKIHFHINDLNEYAQKILKLGKSLVKRNANNELISYVLYYDNGPDIFISMVWTKSEHQGKGLSKRLLLQLIEYSPKEIRLEVNKNNSAKYLYKNLKFIEESENGVNLFMRYPRRLSIMQPYVFPYIGYFHLIEASDNFVFYDDVNYIKRGWINRNRILLNNTDFLFTIPTLKASQNKLINEIKPIIDAKWKRKFYNNLDFAYKKAPYYSDVIKLVKETIETEYSDITDLCIKSIEMVYSYLGKSFNYVKSSDYSPETKGLEKADRLIEITKKAGMSKYSNAIGGQNLYDKKSFKENGIELSFVKSELQDYKQFKNDFVKGLSIIDILMFNDKETVKKYFNDYELI